MSTFLIYKPLCELTIYIELTILSLQRRVDAAETLLCMELKAKLKCVSSHSHLLKMVRSPTLPLSDTISPNRTENLRTQLTKVSLKHLLPTWKQHCFKLYV